MEKKLFRVNIDFELQVQERSSSCLKPSWSREWEYLFWWLEPDHHCIIGDNAAYNTADLNYLSIKTERSLFFSQESHEYSNWWGELNQETIITKFNLPQMRSQIFNDKSSYIGYPKEFPCVIKKEGSFSGKGVYFIKDEQMLAKHPRRDYLVEPLRNRISDYSYYNWGTEGHLFYKTLVDSNGHYRGSIFDNVKSQLMKSNQAKIDEYLASENITHGYGVDSYLYLENDEVKIESLCEVNQRKTIASTAYLIARKFNPGYSLSANYIIPMKKMKKRCDYDDPRVLRISPWHGQHFLHLIIWGSNDEEIELLINELEQFFYSS